MQTSLCMEPSTFLLWGSSLAPFMLKFGLRCLQFNIQLWSLFSMQHIKPSCDFCPPHLDWLCSQRAKWQQAFSICTLPFCRLALHFLCPQHFLWLESPLTSVYTVFCPDKKVDADTRQHVVCVKKINILCNLTINGKKCQLGPTFQLVMNCLVWCLFPVILADTLPLPASFCYFAYFCTNKKPQ